jgi:DNA-binding FrmR family transcriptional regulator
MPNPPGYARDKEQLQRRLRRIEGQVRGIQHMVEDDRYCIDVLTQVNAIKAALDKTALLLLQDHVDHCVADAIRGGRGAPKVQELTTAIGRYLQG